MALTRIFFSDKFPKIWSWFLSDYSNSIFDFWPLEFKFYSASFSFSLDIDWKLRDTLSRKWHILAKIFYVISLLGACENCALEVYFGYFSIDLKYSKLPIYSELLSDLPRNFTNSKFDFAKLRQNWINFRPVWLSSDLKLYWKELGATLNKWLSEVDKNGLIFSTWNCISIG